MTHDLAEIVDVLQLGPCSQIHYRHHTVDVREPMVVKLAFPQECAYQIAAVVNATGKSIECSRRINLLIDAVFTEEGTGNVNSIAREETACYIAQIVDVRNGSRIGSRVDDILDSLLTVMQVIAMDQPIAQQIYPTHVPQVVDRSPGSDYSAWNLKHLHGIDIT